MMSVKSTGTLIYAAGPIDLGKDVPNWRGALMKKLEDNYVDGVLFDPLTAFKFSNLGRQFDRRDAFVEFCNKQALEAADIMVVVFPKGVQSVGTPIEIDMAHRLGKRIILLTDIDRGRSIYLNNRIDRDNWITIADLQVDPTKVDMGLDFVVNNILGVTGL